MTRRERIHLGLAAAALLLATLAAVAGDASPAKAREGAEVTALELARWIREERPNLRVIDLRDTAAFESFAIPGAERVSTSDLARVPWGRNANVVVYADSEPLARDAQQTLRGGGVERAYVLRGGVAEWVNTIAAPVLPANPSPEEAVRSREIAEMSRWFGGTPRVGEMRPVSRDSLREALVRIRRRGC